MSSVNVKVVRISEVRPHENADALEIAVVNGWQVVVPKGHHKLGDLVVYFPPDTVLPPEESDRLGVTKYLKGPEGRVGSIRLRGEPSHGFTAALEGDWPEGADVAEHFRAIKWEPPPQAAPHDAAPQHPLFPKYTDIEDARNWPELLAAMGPVDVTEKIHGRNCRVGVVRGEEMVGSHTQRRKPVAPEQMRFDSDWYPWTIPAVARCLRAAAGLGEEQVVLFGEVYGLGVQSLGYGIPKRLPGGGRAFGFAAFDLIMHGEYVTTAYFVDVCEQWNIPMVPTVPWDGPMTIADAKRIADGRSAVPGADHLREGIVIRPMRSMTHPKIGRVILKYHGDEYLMSKHKEREA